MPGWIVGFNNGVHTVVAADVGSPAVVDLLCIPELEPTNPYATRDPSNTKFIETHKIITPFGDAGEREYVVCVTLLGYRGNYADYMSLKQYEDAVAAGTMFVVARHAAPVVGEAADVPVIPAADDQSESFEAAAAPVIADVPDADDQSESFLDDCRTIPAGLSTASNGSMPIGSHSLGRVVELHDGTNVWLKSYILVSPRPLWRRCLTKFLPVDRDVLQHARRLQKNKWSAFDSRVKRKLAKLHTLI